MTNEKCQLIAKGIADGVQYMHTRKPIIIHQDLNPLNIMVYTAICLCVLYR